MRSLLTRVQVLLMRALGMRKLREALDAKSDAARDTLSVRLDAVQVRLASLHDHLSRQGQAATERGDAVQNALRDLRADLDGLCRSLRESDGIALVLGELRAEMSCLRADFAREAELRDERVGTAGHARAQ